MGKKKNQHFAEMKAMRCVYEPENQLMIRDDNAIKGNWNDVHFRNAYPITLELGCGKGEYAIALGQKYPDRNFVGVDVKGARLWRGARTVEDEAIGNVAFLRIKIEFVHHFFAPGEVDEIWLTFSDPQPKDKKETKRLTGKHLLKRYGYFLKPGGRVHLKTDSEFLYQATLKTIDGGQHTLHFATDNLYEEGLQRLDHDRQQLLQVKTHYEQMFLRQQLPIHYLCFELNDKYHQNS
jgi:tRNA (guanine-N7-)-methyltransferase